MVGLLTLPSRFLSQRRVDYCHCLKKSVELLDSDGLLVVLGQQRQLVDYGLRCHGVVCQRVVHLFITSLELAKLLLEGLALVSELFRRLPVDSATPGKNLANA
jgi:hypothetical protein